MIKLGLKKTWSWEISKPSAIGAAPKTIDELIAEMVENDMQYYSK